MEHILRVYWKNNGLFSKAKLAKGKYEQVFEDENTKINKLYGQIEVATGDRRNYNNRWKYFEWKNRS